MIEIGRFYSTMDKNAMSKIPDCDRCTLYAHNPHLVCAVHPDVWRLINVRTLDHTLISI